MSEIVFVIKVSKLCNLRCSYCYEHRELHVRQRMLMATVRNLFEGIDEFGRQLATLGCVPSFSFVWHGGEPLLLPEPYYREIMALEAEHIRTFRYRNSVQTNLYSADRDSLQLVVESGWELGVSIDFAPDGRRAAGGRESNEAVIAAAEELSKSGASFGILSVLGKHNRHLLADAYDWVSQYANAWRILPVFDGGPEEAISALRLSEQGVVEVLVNIMNRRAAAQRCVPVAPLDRYLSAAALKIAGDRTKTDFRRKLLDNIFIVNVNGDVFTRPFAYDPQFCIGNVNRHRLTKMLQTRAYRSCQSEIRRRKLETCAKCDMRGFCDSSPMHEHGSVVQQVSGRRCFIHRTAIAGVEAELSGAGVDAAVVADWATQWSAATSGDCEPAIV